MDFARFNSGGWELVIFGFPCILISLRVKAVVMGKYDFVKQSDKIRILPISEGEIESAEKRMQFSFPEELRCFYSEIGYGFIRGSKSFANRIMPPVAVADYVCFDDFYEYVDRSIYSDDDIPFFDLSAEDFLMIRKDGKIVYFGDIIADSFTEFIEKELENPDYFINKQ